MKSFVSIFTMIIVILRLRFRYFTKTAHIDQIEGQPQSVMGVRESHVLPLDRPINRGNPDEDAVQYLGMVPGLPSLREEKVYLWDTYAVLAKGEQVLRAIINNSALPLTPDEQEDTSEVIQVVSQLLDERLTDEQVFHLWWAFVDCGYTGLSFIQEHWVWRWCLARSPWIPRY